MVFVHGGAWTIGSKEQQCRPMLFELAARGWVVVSCNYRLSPTATWPDHIVDVKRVLAWTRVNVAEYGGDAARFLGISGNSAGGHLAALAALTPGEVAWQPGFEDADTAVDACVSIYGVLDMTGDPDIAGPQGRALQSLLGHSVIKQLLDDAHDTYEASSPLHRLSGEAPPFLVVHGTKDTLVSIGVARAFVAAFERAATAPICYVELPWAQHGYDTLCSPRCSATVVGIARFLDALVAARTARRVP
jgi:acetyl esterase/lipase